MKWCLRIFVLLLGVTIIYSCTNKAAPTIPQRPVEPVTGNKPDTADFNSTSPLVAGQAIYKIKCITCHKEKPVGDWTQEEWKPILNSMVKKAKLDELQISQVTTYVNANAKK